MSDYRIRYNEEMVGAGHPTKEDTLNRLALVECGVDGKGRQRYLVKQATPPATGADELALFAQETDGELRLFWRPADNADPQEVLGGVEVVQEGEYTLAVSGSGWQTASIPLTSVDPATHACELAIFAPGLGAGNATIVKYLQFYLAADQIELRHFTDNVTSGNAVIPWVVYRVPGLRGPIQRGKTDLVFDQGLTTNPITLAALPNYAKSLARATHKGQTYLAANGLANYLYHARLKLVSATTLQVYGQSYQAGDTYKVFWEVWPR